ncbi:MAG: hypothetical protein AAFY29_09400 [Pseudomonadota bacterium]
MRVIYLLIFLGQSSFVWRQLFFESAEWPVMTGVAKSMMAAMALLCLLGIRYPLQLLPVLLFETLWKTLWILLIALPARDSGQWAVIESTFYESVGIIVAYFILPWTYVWSRFFRQPGEPWRQSCSSCTR